MKLGNLFRKKDGRISKTRVSLAGIVTSLVASMLTPDGKGGSVFNSAMNKIGNDTYRWVSSHYEVGVDLVLPEGQTGITDNDITNIINDYHTRVSQSRTVEGTQHPFRPKWSGLVTDRDVREYSQSWWWPILDKYQKSLKNGESDYKNEHIYEDIAKIVYNSLKERNPNSSDREIILFMYNMFSRRTIGYKCRGFSSEYIRRFEIEGAQAGNAFAGIDKFIHFVEGARMFIAYGNVFTTASQQLWETKDLLKGADGFYEANDIIAGKRGSEWAKRMLLTSH